MRQHELVRVAAALRNTLKTSVSFPPDTQYFCVTILGPRKLQLSFQIALDGHYQDVASRGPGISIDLRVYSEMRQSVEGMEPTGKLAITNQKVLVWQRNMRPRRS